MIDLIRSGRSRGLAGLVGSVSAILLVSALAADDAAAAICRTRHCSPAASPAPAAPAADNFLTYVVTLNSLQLISNTGRKVQVLPAPLQVDLAQTVNLQLAVDSGTVPVGTYTSAQAVIDFSHADITAEDSSGARVTLNAIDAAGSPLTTPQTVSIQLDHQRSFVVSTINAALDSLDFNLGASNSVNLQNATVGPKAALIADVVPSGNSWVRLIGTIASVDTAADSFVLAVPTTAVNSSAAGPVAVQLTATTSYRISGAAYTGDAGAAMLATVPKGKVTATGSLSSDHKTLVASSIVVS